MTARATVITWLLLLVLLGVEILASSLPVARVAAPFVGIAMVVVVAMTFMRLASTPGVAGAFAMAGVFWLAIMMGLGSLDSATRHDIPVSMRTEP